MKIPRALYDEMVAHAREDAPNECCGMVSSRGDKAVAVHRLENTAHSPLRYEMEPQELYNVYMAIDDAELDLGAIYHSHTRSPPFPSQTDVNLATYPDSLYIIVGLQPNLDAEVRAYTIRKGQIEEAVLTVV